MKSKFTPKIWLVAATSFLLTLYVVLCPLNAPLYDLIMFPFPDPRVVDLSGQFAALRGAGISQKDVELTSADGKHLQAWFFERRDTRRVFLYSHSKGNNMYGKIHVVEALLACGGSVFIYDYQGYGRSEGRATIQHCCDDGLAAYDYLVSAEHREPTEIIGFGESLGSGVTGQIARQRKFSGVIFQSGFASLRSAGENSLFWLKYYPDWCFPKQQMDNVGVFSKPHPPLFMSHGTNDPVVSYENALELYEKSVAPKRMLTIDKSGHGTVGAKGEFYTALRKFIADYKL